MEFQKNKSMVNYRDQEYIISDIKKETYGRNEVTFLKLKIPNGKYDVWVNSNYVVKCR